MEELGVLRDLVILIGVAIPVVIVAERLKVPAVVAFLLVGVAIGPHGLALIGRPESVSALAELGVVLLLFTIGLELSLSRIMRLGRVVLQGGGLQVGVTMLLVAAIAMLKDVPANRAAFYGALVALSSTAIVLKIYAGRGELDTPHGRVVVSILLFQDLCVVPLMLLIPLLADVEAGLTARALGEVATSMLVVAALVAGGRIVVPRVLNRVALLRHREVFTLCIGFFGLGAAFVTASFGLSLALGAFIAGLVISESEYGLQALSDVLPFRDTFSGIFFISIGMLLDTRFVLTHPVLVVGGAAGVLLLKSGIATAVVLSLRRTVQASVLSALGLAQVGEFSFVLASEATPLNLLTPEGYQLFLSASVLSMLAAPFVIAGARPFANWWARRAGRPGLVVLPYEKPKIAALEDHAIIVGYGLSGQHLAQVLQAAGIRYVVLEQNGQRVQRARETGIRIFFGDGTNREVLTRVGIARARVLVFAIASPTDERRGVAVAHELNPAARIVVRTRYVAAIDELKRLGASEVVVEEFEATLELFARVLEQYEIPSNTIQREVDAVRGERYSMLRGLSLPTLRLDTLKHLGVHGALDLVEVENGARALGESPTSLNLRQETGAVVIAVVRDGAAFYTPDPTFRFRAGDTVVLVGEPAALVRGGAVFRALGRNRESGALASEARNPRQR